MRHVGSHILLAHHIRLMLIRIVVLEEIATRQTLLEVLVIHVSSDIFDLVIYMLPRRARIKQYVRRDIVVACPSPLFDHALEDRIH